MWGHVGYVGFPLPSLFCLCSCSCISFGVCWCLLTRHLSLRFIFSFISCRLHLELGGYIYVSVARRCSVLLKVWVWCSFVLTVCDPSAAPVHTCLCFRGRAGYYHSRVAALSCLIVWVSCSLLYLRLMVPRPSLPPSLPPSLSVAHACVCVWVLLFSCRCFLFCRSSSPCDRVVFFCSCSSRLVAVACCCSCRCFVSLDDCVCFSICSCVDSCRPCLFSPHPLLCASGCVVVDCLVF